MDTKSSPIALTVYLADSSPVVRDRLKVMLSEIGCTVVGETASVGTTIEGIISTTPDVVLMDLHLKDGVGLDVLRKVHAKNPNVAFIVISMQADHHYEKVCREAGARYFLDKFNELGNIAGIIDEIRIKLHRKD